MSNDILWLRRQILLIKKMQDDFGATMAVRLSVAKALILRIEELESKLAEATRTLAETGKQ